VLAGGLAAAAGVGLALLVAPRPDPRPAARRPARPLGTVREEET
jgi:hypothetical protein